MRPIVMIKSKEEYNDISKWHISPERWSHWQELGALCMKWSECWESYEAHYVDKLHGEYEWICFAEYKRRQAKEHKDESTKG